MAVPFGFSVGDFLAVGKLIRQVAVELRENDEASPEYQSLLIELEALERALRKLQTLKPGKHELLQLTSIRATALACQRPLQNFLAKISKFESRLGAFSTANNGWKGLPRKLQFRIMFKEDVKELRSALASHVATINLLLMTQAVASISTAEDDRDRFASGLESKILAHRRLLEDISAQVDTSLERQQRIKTQLREQSAALNKLGKKADKTRKQLSGQEASIQEIQSIANHTQEQTKSVLATVTEILALVTSGLMHLRQITKQLHKMIRICTTFTAEMRAAMSKLMELFFSLQTVLERIDRNLPTRLYLPTVRLTTALGETMALPYQLCQRWETFTELLRVIFLDKPGKSRVDMGKYLIMNARGGRLLGEDSWQHAVKQDDHLSMSILLDELAARAGSCPFPSCQASTEGVEIENGGRTCRKCDRWSLLTPLEPAILDDAFHYLDQIKIQYTDYPDIYDKFLDIMKMFKNRMIDTPGVIRQVASLFTGSSNLIRRFNWFLTPGYWRECGTNNDPNAKSSSDSDNGQLVENKEDIELYRQIHVEYLPEETPQPSIPMPFTGPRPMVMGRGQWPSLDDVLNIVNQVEIQFTDYPDTYQKFLDILRDYNNRTIHIPEVVEQALILLAGNTNLILGLINFLPPAYKIEYCTNGDPNVFRVTTPMGTVVSITQPPQSYVPRSVPEPVAESNHVQEEDVVAHDAYLVDNAPHKCGRSSDYSTEEDNSCDYATEEEYVEGQNEDL
ncbi:hypothetical protein DL771_006010 [Monosporascus sp. 5C6A]|nr:hypothetical protein DL771_006010 [Monosporascus sp. 5C6A]